MKPRSKRNTGMARSRYRLQTETTTPGRYAGVYDAFPSTLKGILRFISGKLMLSFPHPEATPDQRSDHRVNTVEGMLKVLRQRQKSFVDERPPQKKFLGLCYHWSILAASVLRSRGRICRVRCGFAPYLAQEAKGIDHTIIEVWKGGSTGWQLIDGELADLPPDALAPVDGVPFDPFRLSRGRFDLGGAAWRKLRAKAVPDGYYGLYDKQPSYRFVRASLIRDWLNVLGHERNVSCNPKLAAGGRKKEDCYLDGIAQMMEDVDGNLDILERMTADIRFVDCMKGAADDDWADLRALPPRR